MVVEFPSSKILHKLGEISVQPIVALPSPQDLIPQKNQLFELLSTTLNERSRIIMDWVRLGASYRSKSTLMGDLQSSRIEDLNELLDEIAILADIIETISSTLIDFDYSEPAVPV